MGWMQYTAELVGHLAWPVALVVVAVIVILKFRMQLAALIDRIKRVRAAGAEIELSEAASQLTATVADVARTDIDPEKLAEEVSVRVVEAGGSPPPVDLEVQIRAAIADDELRRRPDIERLLATAVHHG